MRSLSSLVLWGSVSLCLCASVTSAQDWPAHRGGPGRTGNVDGKAGPAAPKVLWAYKSKEHFLAPPALAGDRLLVVALGAFNTGSLRAFEASSGKPGWNKSAPIIRLPTVGTPAVAGGTSWAKLVETDAVGSHRKPPASACRVAIPGGTA